MKFQLSDGTVAHMNGIVQASAHLRDYMEQPSDAVSELKRIAITLMPPSAWRRAPIVFLQDATVSLADLMRSKMLPRLICVGEFVSYRTDRRKAMFLNVVWLQEDFTPHMHPDVQRLFADIKWPDPNESEEAQQVAPSNR